MDSQSIDNSVPRVTPPDGAWPQRVDWRTGKVVYSRDAEFWCAHERRRIDQGLTVGEYCKANDLATSTYRRRAKGPGDAAAGSARGQGPVQASVPGPGSAGASPGGRFVALPTSAATGVAAEGSDVVVRTAQGLAIELAGAAADQLLQRLFRSLP